MKNPTSHKPLMFMVFGALLTLGVAGTVGAGTRVKISPPETKVIAPTIRTAKCGSGYHWDSKLKHCVTNAKLGQPCAAGYYWDSALGRCVNHGSGGNPCPKGLHWSADRKRCVTNTCPKGFRWNKVKGHCVPF